MSLGYLLEYSILSFLLILSAFFSGSEAALFSLTGPEQESLKRRAAPAERRILEIMLSRPDEMLVAILTGNMIVNMIAASLAEAAGERIFSVDSELFSIICITLILLLIGEMAPKTIAVRHSPAFMRVVSRPLYFLFLALKPLCRFLNLFNRWTGTLVPAPELSGSAASRKIILPAVRVGYREGILNQSELHLFESFFEFRNMSAADIMIPRVQLGGLEVSMPLSRLLRQAHKLREMACDGLIPVYQQDLDHLVGCIGLKDLLPYRFALKQAQSLGQIVKPILSVPSFKNLAQLMVEMRRTNSEMAQIVDEYGGTAGVITFQMMVEELLGYFYASEPEGVVQTAPGTYRLPGNLEMDALASLLGTAPETESRTVAGFVIEKLGEIPAPGTVVKTPELEIAVRRIARNRILEVEVKRLS